MKTYFLPLIPSAFPATFMAPGRVILKQSDAAWNLQFCHGFEEKEAKRLTRKCFSIAKNIGRIDSIRKLALVKLSDETLRLILKELIEATSELDDDLIPLVQNLTGWEYCEIQCALDRLATLGFIERARCCHPYRIIRRW